MKLRKIFVTISTITLMATLLATTAISCFASGTTADYFNKPVKTYRISTVKGITTMSSIPGYTTVHANDSYFDYDYKVAAYDEYGEKGKLLNHKWNDGYDYIVSTDPYQTVSNEAIERYHYCDIKVGGVIKGMQYVLITSKTAL